MTLLGVNGVAVLSAAVAGWLFGAVWYGVLGARWIVALGTTREALMGPGGRPSPAPFVISFVAEIVMAWVLAGILVHAAADGGLRAGLVAGFLAWLGFVATTQVVNNAYSRRGLALTVIDAGHWLGVLLVQGAVLGLVGVR